MTFINREMVPSLLPPCPINKFEIRLLMQENETGRPKDEVHSKIIYGCCHLVSGESKSLYNLGICREDKFLPN